MSAKARVVSRRSSVAAATLSYRTVSLPGRQVPASDDCGDRVPSKNLWKPGSVRLKALLDTHGLTRAQTRVNCAPLARSRSLLAFLARAKGCRRDARSCGGAGGRSIVRCY